jgi:hypothetical protein
MKTVYLKLGWRSDKLIKKERKKERYYPNEDHT